MELCWSQPVAFIVPGNCVEVQHATTNKRHASADAKLNAGHAVKKLQSAYSVFCSKWQGTNSQTGYQMYWQVNVKGQEEHQGRTAGREAKNNALAGARREAALVSPTATQRVGK